MYFSNIQRVYFSLKSKIKQKFVFLGTEIFTTNSKNTVNRMLYIKNRLTFDFAQQIQPLCNIKSYFKQTIFLTSFALFYNSRRLAFYILYSYPQVTNPIYPLRSKPRKSYLPQKSFQTKFSMKCYCHALNSCSLHQTCNLLLSRFVNCSSMNIGLSPTGE